MYKYLLMFVLFTPLYGIWLVEDGAESLSTGIAGTRNGATLAFAGYAMLLVAVAWLTANISVWPRTRLAAPVEPADPATARYEFMYFSRRLLVVNVLFLFMMLFGFGAINVWLGTVEKGAFRANLGPFGAVPYLLTKFAVPALFAYLTVLLIRTGKERSCTWMWYLNAAVVFLGGSTWGFKTTGLFMLLPGLLILNWKLSVRRMALFAAIFAASLVWFALWFDAGADDFEVFAFLFGRLTILQGDVSWYVWGLYQDGVALPNYWPTLLAAFGDTLTGLFVSKTSLVEWMAYHYDWMLTYLTGTSLEAIANGHSVTGTPFAEGVIAGGAVGVALFATVAGMLAGGLYRALGGAIRRGQPMLAALLSTYFCFHVFSWLNGGGITQLFHISVIANVVIAFCLLKLLSAPRVRRVAGTST